MTNELVSMAQQFTGLPMEDLIGGPLNAAAKANAAMALTQTKFLLETCFTTVESTDPDTKKRTVTYKPVMIEMSLERGVTGYETKTEGDKTEEVPVINTVTTTFNLPMLTIIPINSLAVTSVDVDFEMEVKSSYSESEHQESSHDTEAQCDIEAKLGLGLLSVSIKGSASYSSKDSATHDTHYEKSNSAKYTVRVQAGQLPVPKGVNTIIEAFKLVKEHNHKLAPWCMRDLCEFLVYSQKEFWDTVDKHYYNRLFQEGQFRTLDSEVIISEMNSGQERNINTVIHFVLLTTT